MTSTAATAEAGATQPAASPEAESDGRALADPREQELANSGAMTQGSVSVVIAVFDEVDSLPALADELRATFAGSDRRWEVIFVDDGSTVGSRRVERRICHEDPHFRSVHLRRNFGKAAALDVGFRRARGDIVVTMDADLQDDPGGIADLIAPIEDGSADLVSGWKYPRRDPLSKRIPSKIYNTVTKLATGLALHDMNCGFKAYRREVIGELSLYGEMHRYIPVIASGAGFTVTEVKVNHRARQHGASKYAYARFVRGFLDLLTVVFITRYRRRPLHLIGGLGLLMGGIGLAILLYLTGLWFLGEPIGSRPLLALGMLLILVAGQFFTFGLLAEMTTYYSHPDRNDYPVIAEIGFDTGDDGVDSTFRSA